jgi:type IV secretion system protein VirB10
MNNRDQGAVNFERKEQKTSETVKKKRAVLVFAALVLLLGVIIYVVMASITDAVKAKAGPTMADGKKQEEKLRKKRYDDEKRLGQMRDKLVENPGTKKDTNAERVLKDFERIYEKIKKNNEKNLKERGNVFGNKLEKYGRFEIDKYGEPNKYENRNSGVRNSYQDKKEKKSMIVIADEAKEDKGNKDNSKTDEFERRLGQVIASIEKGKINNTGNQSDSSNIKGILEANGSGNVPQQQGLSKREKTSITLSYNNKYPIVTLYEGEFLEGVILNEIRSDIQEGPVIVKTSKDFYDESGVYVIIPYGTKVLGRTQAINYKGQKRLYIWFERIILPVRKIGERRASIELPTKSTALDRHGISGLVSKVNRHFWLQYGSAVLLGVLDGIAGLVKNLGGSGSVSIVVDGSGQNISRVNDALFNNFANIMPTITVKPGSKVKIYITSDINITAYDLKENRPYETR